MSDPDRYLALQNEGVAETKVKGSRFLGIAWPVRSAGESGERLEALRREHHDATHVCFAWRIGHGEEMTTRAADAGEPGGSAGLPILGAIERAELSDCAVAVIRWFGGTKLGTGGLKRAYGECAALALEDGSTATRVLRNAVRIAFAYSHTTLIHRLAARHDAVEGDSNYGEEVEITYHVPRSGIGAFCDELVEATAGKIRMAKVE